MTKSDRKNRSQGFFNVNYVKNNWKRSNSMWNKPERCGSDMFGVMVMLWKNVDQSGLEAEGQKCLKLLSLCMLMFDSKKYCLDFRFCFFNRIV